MKKYITAAICLLAAAMLLASCSANANPVSTAPVENAPEPTGTENVVESGALEVYGEGTEGAAALVFVPDWSDFYGYTVATDPDVPDFLTPDQQDLFRAARRMYDGFEGCSAGYDKDYSAMIEVPREGKDWSDSYLLDNGFAGYQDFVTAMHAVFTDAFCEELLHSDGTPAPMIEHEGKLYSLYADRGSDLEYLSTSYALENRSEGQISFFMVGHYNRTAYDSQTPDPSQDYTQEYPIRMEHTEHGWRFSCFAIPN